MLHDKLYVMDVSIPELLISSLDNLSSWTTVETPTSYSALTTYHSQLVLIGGMEASSYEATNKLWISEHDAIMNWKSSLLPPMPTRRYRSSAVTTGTPESIIVAGGQREDRTYLDTVEAFVQEQWSTCQPLPKPCLMTNSTIHNGKLYLMGGIHQGYAVFYCDLVSLISSSQCEQTLATSLWNKFDACETDSIPVSMGQHLIAMGENTINAFSSPTKSWIRVEDLPVGVICSAAIVLPNGVLFMIGYVDDGYRVFKVSLISKFTLFLDIACHNDYRLYPNFCFLMSMHAAY